MKKDLQSRQKISVNPVVTTIIGLIRAYKFLISPLFPNTCRFHPTCSTYAIDALSRYGLLKGLFLSVKRIVKCNPWHPGGFDPLP